MASLSFQEEKINLPTINMSSSSSCITSDVEFKELSESVLNGISKLSIHQEKRKRPVVNLSLPSSYLISNIKLQEPSKSMPNVSVKKSVSKKSNNVCVSDISTFFNISTRNANDATNKIRESILEIISDPPENYFKDEEFGNYWRILYNEWNSILKKIADDTNISTYTHTKNIIKAGRMFNYDMDVIYYNNSTIVANRKIEFKNGGTNISELPQFLSLQTKIELFQETYDKFYYENYLDKYMMCDSGITEEKPSLQDYLKKVTSTNYSITPFFNQLKTRELFFQKEKNEVVNNSIKDYLTTYGMDMNIKMFSEKVRATQIDKIYLLWSNQKFYLDKLSEVEMSDMSFHSIRNGNIIELKSGTTKYGLLLRWRNHKGILNPAWQISMKRNL